MTPTARTPDLAFQSAATYLRGLGITNQSELTMVLDIAMNPYSVYGKASRKQAANPHVSRTRALGCCWWRARGRAAIQSCAVTQAAPLRNLHTSLLAQPPVHALHIAPWHLPSTQAPQPGTTPVCPQARRLSVEEDIKPVVEFLLALGLDQAAVGGAIMRHPPLLCYSVEGRLAPLVEFLQQELRLSREQVRMSFPV